MYPMMYYVFPTIFVLFLLRKYREAKWGKCKNRVMLDRKIALVTGANSGIGLQIAKELAARNAQVIVACRDIDKAREACINIETELYADPVLIPMELDLASLKSIKAFVDEVKKRYKQIHILINNAGVSYPNNKQVQTADNFEIHFGVNYLGHFYLTNLLLDELSSGCARVVVISSSLHERGEIKLDDLNSLKPMKKTNLYANSKLANIYFAQELARRTQLRNIKVYACCPGWVYTGLFRYNIRWYHYFLLLPVAYILRTPQQGVQTPLYCATEPELEKETGLLYSDCKHYNSRVIFDDSVAIKLWEETDKMINKALENHSDK